jgi:WD40 repeat protein/DNA-binding winged helix-turn-helix (wHTH) protein
MEMVRESSKKIPGKVLEKSEESMSLKTGRLYEFRPFCLDTDEWRLSHGGKPVELTPKGLELLALLVENQGHLVTREEIKHRIWPGTLVVTDSNLTFHIAAIRRALGDENRDGYEFIENVPTRGYRFIAPVRLTEKVPELAAATERVATVCPYRGLRPFHEQDAPFFAGREELAKRLLEVTLARSFVAVVGSSGSGKSSAVQAGLVPLLRQQRSPHAVWQVLSFTPGDRPFHRLCAATVPFLDAGLAETERLTETHKLGDLLAARELRLSTVWERVIRKSTCFDRLLIIADQFEELFALAPQAEQHAFVETILEGLGMGRVTFLLTLRADFYAHAVSLSRDLSDQLQNGIVNLGPMTGNELMRAIVEPAKRVGLEFEQGLAQRILDDVMEQPGNLPLLQFALTALWNDRRGALLTHSSYEGMGKVAGAVATRAEAVFSEHTPEHQSQIRHFFTRLVRVNRPEEGGEDVRQRVDLSELDTGSQRIARTLAAADMRLVVIGRDESTGEETVEVAHEALIRRWARFAEWLNEDREFLLWRQRLRSGLAEYERNAGDKGSLLRGAPLAEAERWLLRRPLDLADGERRFISDSVAIRERAREEEERRRQNEMEVAKRLREAANRLADTERQRAAEKAEHVQRLRRLIRVLGVMLLLTIAGAVFSLWQRAVARAQELVAASRAAEGTDPELSLLIAAQGVASALRWSSSVLPEAEEQLHRSILASHVKRSLIGHLGWVWGVAWSPDGKRLATGSADHTAKIWDAETGRELFTLYGHKEAVSKVAWSPHGNRIATSSEDGTAKVWDAETGSELVTLGGHIKAVDSIAWSPDGQSLATASADGTAREWDVQSGIELLALRGHRGAVISVAWSPDGKRLATGGEDSLARVWDAATGTEVLELRGHRFAVDSVAWSPDGKLLATGSWDNTAKVWDVATGTEVLALRGHGQPVCSVAWNPDGKRLATGGEDSTAAVWDAKTGKELLTLRGHADSIWSVAWSPDGKWLATASADSTVKVWEVEASKELVTLSGHAEEVAAVAWSRDQKWLATGSFDGRAKVWDTHAWKDVLALQGHAGRVYSVTWSPDGKRLATGSEDKTVKSWDARTGTERQALQGHAGRVYSVTWSPDGKRLATGSEDKTARVWDAETGKELLTLRGHSGPVHGVAWSPDGRWLATGSWDNNAKVWDPRTGEELLALRGHTAEIYSIAWAPDGKRLATGGNDKTAKVWDAKTGKELLSLRGHTGCVSTLAWSPNGKFLATGSFDNTTKVWDAETGKGMLTLNGHDDHVWSVAWSPDGKQLATASGDRTVQIYAMDIHDLMTLARERVTAYPSEDGCQRFLHVDKCPPFPKLW